jgi:hypothetical protein
LTIWRRGGSLFPGFPAFIGFLPNRRRGIVGRATRADNALAGAIAAIGAHRRGLAFVNQTDQDTTPFIIERISPSMTQDE